MDANGIHLNLEDRRLSKNELYGMADKCLKLRRGRPVYLDLICSPACADPFAANENGEMKD